MLFYVDFTLYPVVSGNEGRRKVNNLDYSRVKNAVRSDDDAACEGVLKYVEQAARKPMRKDCVARPKGKRCRYKMK